jgi:hypothetical protein
VEAEEAGGSVDGRGGACVLNRVIGGDCEEVRAGIVAGLHIGKMALSSFVIGPSGETLCGRRA